LFAEWPSSVIAALGFSEAEAELDLPDRDGGTRRSYRITVASSSALDRSADWKLLVFNDITGQKRDARDLASTNEELEFWVKQRTAALRLEVAQRTTAEERLRELNEEITETQREILWTLSEVVENRSRETAFHVVRVGEYARILSQGYGLSTEEVEIITAAAPMHDVGKIAIPDAILSKPGQLTDDEREQMKRHTIVGKEILGSSQRPLLRAASIIAHEHHERWDGKGYPVGTAGSDISLSGRIVSLCDVFDALYTKRVYKEAWPLEQVLDLCRAESGKAFEPRLVDIFFDSLDDILVVTERFADLPILQAG
jgi:putative two-component system response regulator